MAELIADYALERLAQCGVHRIYGCPGDGINAFSAQKMAEAMVKGDPERVRVMEKALLGKLEEFKESLPGRK
jgi:pyruvate dehydrogenase (quinone)